MPVYRYSQPRLRSRAGRQVAAWEYCKTGQGSRPRTALMEESWLAQSAVAGAWQQQCVMGRLPYANGGLWLWDRAPELRRWRSVRAKYGCTSEFADVDSDVCVCSMFGGSKLAQNTTMLWGSHKKKAIKSNPWVSFS